jgi:flagellar assembly factor FliW
MKVETTRFGAVEIVEEKLISFPFGLPGFDNLKSWCVLHTEGHPGVHWLQSVDDSDIALLIADPEQLFPDYDVTIQDTDLACIGVVIDESTTEPPPVVMRVVLSVDRLKGMVTANLRAPILIHLDQHLAVQIPLTSGNYSVRQPLPKTENKKVEKSEVKSDMEHLLVATGS